MIGIYKIENKINGKVYIGQSVDIDRRFREHKRRSEQQIDFAIQKYGIDNFNFDIIEECSLSDLNDKEEYWTLYYNSIIPNGYNLGIVKSFGVGEENPSSILTNEDIKIIRECYKNKTFSSAAELARQLYPERSAEYISQIFYGKLWTHIYMEVYTPELREYYKDIFNHSGVRRPGEGNPAALLNEKDVIRMRVFYQTKSRDKIFLLFPQYKERTIKSILTGQNWKHLPIYKKQQKIWLFPDNWPKEKQIDFLNSIKEDFNE